MQAKTHSHSTTVCEWKSIPVMRSSSFCGEGGREAVEESLGAEAKQWGGKGYKEKRLQWERYLEQLVILLSQHGSTFNRTGTNSCVLRRFCHANTLGQLRFRRFRGGFCESVCTKLGFLQKPSLIRVSLNCKERALGNYLRGSRREDATWVETKRGTRRDMFLLPNPVSASCKANFLQSMDKVLSLLCRRSNSS